MPQKENIKTIAIFHRQNNPVAAIWTKKIQRHLKAKHPAVKISEKNPQAVIALGGDGAILEAARKYMARCPVILGLNLGRVGFLASVRNPKNFMNGIERFLSGDYGVSERVMLESRIYRKGKVVFRGEALNDIVLQNLIGVSEIELKIGNEPIQYIRGTGALISTATGSTAYNLSAHGPIVMPTIKCLIITELLDHNIPTPSIVLPSGEKILLKITDFRKRDVFAIKKNGKAVDMILSADGENIFPLAIGDKVSVQSSPHLVKFAELEKNYFFKSLKEKFAFR